MDMQGALQRRLLKKIGGQRELTPADASDKGFNADRRGMAVSTQTALGRKAKPGQRKF